MVVVGNNGILPTMEVWIRHIETGQIPQNQKGAMLNGTVNFSFSLLRRGVCVCVWGNFVADVWFFLIACALIA